VGAVVGVGSTMTGFLVGVVVEAPLAAAVVLVDEGEFDAGADVLAGAWLRPVTALTRDWTLVVKHEEHNVDARVASEEMACVAESNEPPALSGRTPEIVASSAVAEAAKSLTVRIDACLPLSSKELNNELEPDLAWLVKSDIGWFSFGSLGGV
jgi:hypothetical protein